MLTNDGGSVYPSKTGKMLPNPNWNEPLAQKYPDTPWNDEKIPEINLGISRRNWLAGLAMGGMLGEDPWPINSLVDEAYEIADAMIKRGEE